MRYFPLCGLLLEHCLWMVLSWFCHCYDYIIMVEFCSVYLWFYYDSVCIHSVFYVVWFAGDTVRWTHIVPIHPQAPFQRRFWREAKKRGRPTTELWRRVEHVTHACESCWLVRIARERPAWRSQSRVRGSTCKRSALMAWRLAGPSNTSAEVRGWRRHHTRGGVSLIAR